MAGIRIRQPIDRKPAGRPHGRNTTAPVGRGRQCRIAAVALMAVALVAVACSSMPDDDRLEALKTLGSLTVTVSDRLEAIWAQRIAETIRTPQQGTPVPPVHQCDIAAADPRDPQRVVAGLHSRDIDARLAVRACGRALDRHPAASRFKYQMARAFELAGNRSRGLQLLQEAAREGYRIAQEALGEIYLTRGQRLNLDIAPAIRWLEKAAVAGAPVAQYQLGRLLFTGNGIARDPKRGRDLIAEAAFAGYPRAQRTVGGLNMAGGDGIKQNPRKGFVWFRRAAEGGDPSAQFFVSKFYKAGVGTQRNDEEALRWLKTAAGTGHPAAQALLGAELLGFGALLEADMPRAYFWMLLANREGVLEVTPLVSYAADQLDAATLRHIDREVGRWQPYDAVPDLSPGDDPVLPDDRPTPEDADADITGAAAEDDDDESDP